MGDASDAPTMRKIRVSLNSHAAIFRHNCIQYEIREWCGRPHPLLGQVAAACCIFSLSIESQDNRHSTKALP